MVENGPRGRLPRLANLAGGRKGQLPVGNTQNKKAMFGHVTM